MLSNEFKFHYLLHSAHLLEERLRVRLAPLGVLPRQARILDALHRMGDATQVELAKEFDLTAASMSTMTSRLIEAGFIERHMPAGGRATGVLRLSKDGAALLDAIYREWRALDAEIVKALGSTGATDLAKRTLKLRNALGGRTPGVNR